jgi:hypothetical protein
MTGDAERTQDRQTDRKWDHVEMHSISDAVLRWRCTATSLLLFSVILFIYSASFLYLYSLRPYSFAVL